MKDKEKPDFIAATGPGIFAALHRLDVDVDPHLYIALKEYVRQPSVHVWH